MLILTLCSTTSLAYADIAAEPYQGNDQAVEDLESIEEIAEFVESVTGTADIKSDIEEKKLITLQKEKTVT